MCGIAGFSGDVGGELLDLFVQRLAHRGPDDHGTWSSPGAGAGLAHTRLSILDLSPRGHQPMVDAASGCRIVYNGELYNFRDLRRQLEGRGHGFISDTDTEVLLRLYLDRGADMLPLLDGIFAFAIWDPRSDEILLARDAVGVKPLYWTATPGAVLFASEIKALLASNRVARQLDLQAVDATVTHLWCPGPRTVLRGVFKLEPGTAMALRRGKVARVWRWFELPVQEPWAGAPPGLRDDPVAILRAELEQAITDQLVSDVPVGAFLSGGIDSSALVAFASRRIPRLPCFTMRLPPSSHGNEGFDEDLPYAHRVADHLGVDLIEVPVGNNTAAELEDMVYQLDEPQADIAPLHVRKVAEAARASGIKVLLSGAGGDDLFAGYRRHQAAALDRLWGWLPQAARRGLRKGTARLPADVPWARRVRKVFREADLGVDERIAAYFDWIGADERRSIYSPMVAAALGATPAYHPLLDAERRLSPAMHPVNRTLYLDTRYFLPDHNLNYTDKMAMAVGVEVRVPLLARRLIQLAAALPIDDKFRRGTGKWILREAVRPLLPAAVLGRSKTGFGAPLRSWLHGELAPLVSEVLSPTSLRRHGIFDAVAVDRLRADDRAGKIDAAYPLLAVVCIELWCRRFGITA